MDKTAIRNQKTINYKEKLKLYFLSHTFCLFLIGFSYCSTQVSPTLLPSTVGKTIKRFNYCLNHIDKPDIFELLDEILIGKAKDEFEELNELLSGGVSTSTSAVGSVSQGRIGSTGQSLRNTKDSNLKKQLDEYQIYAQALKIKINKIIFKNEKAKAIVYFYDSRLVIDEKKIFSLKKDGELWKIAEISAFTNTNEKKIPNYKVNQTRQ